MTEHILFILQTFEQTLNVLYAIHYLWSLWRLCRSAKKLSLYVQRQGIQDTAFTDVVWSIIRYSFIPEIFVSKPAWVQCFTSQSVKPFYFINCISVLASYKLSAIFPASNGQVSLSWKFVWLFWKDAFGATLPMTFTSCFFFHCILKVNIRPPDMADSDMFPWGVPTRHVETQTCVWSWGYIGAVYSSLYQTAIAVSFRLTADHVCRNPPDLDLLCWLPLLH